MTSTQPKMYTINYKGEEINLNAVKEIGVDNWKDDTEFRAYLDKLSKKNGKVLFEKMLNETFRIFKVILKKDTQTLVNDMYTAKLNMWRKSLNCNQTTDDRCGMNPPEFFYGFLVVDKKRCNEIINKFTISKCSDEKTDNEHPDCEKIDTDYEQNNCGFLWDYDDFEKLPSSKQGGNRRRRNNKKSKRKSKNNRKKTNRRR